MKNLSVSLTHCYGISSLNYFFDFEKSKIYSIYASNGIMKTSFQKTFDAIKPGKEPKDDIFREEKYKQKTECSILLDGSEISEEDIFVIKPFSNIDNLQTISDLLVDDNIKQKIKTYIETKMGLLKQLAKSSGYKVDEIEQKIKDDFDLESNNIVENIKNITECKIDNNFEHIKMKEIFNLEEKLKNSDLQKNLRDYIKTSNSIYESYSFLSQGKFTLPALKKVEKSLNDENFWIVNENGVFLKGQEKLLKADDIKTQRENIEKELKTTKEFKEIKKFFETAGGAALQQIIENNIELLEFLEKGKIDELKKIFWHSYIEEIKKEENNIIDIIKRYYETLQKEIKKQNIEDTRRGEAVKEFNQRFSVPFTIHIENKDVALIGEVLPKVVFRFYKDGDKTNLNENNIKDIDRNELNSIDTLSQGEKRALYLLHIIFDVKLRQEQQKQTLFIIDDIADSFDYKNKYAIIEYLNEMNEEDKFKMIILTHNFDFYRNIQSRLDIRSGIIGDTNREGANLKAEKKEGEIVLKSGANLFNLISNCISNYDRNIQSAIALIPVAREIVNYAFGKEHENGYYDILTNILHIKNTNIDLSKLYSIFEIVFCSEAINDGEEVIVQDEIIKECDRIIKNQIDSLPVKIVLSIGIRLKAEKFMLSKLTEEKEYTGPQTRQLFNDVKSLLTKEEKELMNKVMIMTPESIHINSFMYEPLIDMSDRSLRELYKEIPPI